MKSKVLAKILKDTRFARGDDDLLREYATFLDENEDDGPRPKEKDKNNYIGLEIECLTSLTRGQVVERMLEHDLEQQMQITGDGSIHGEGRGVEFRILFKEKTLVKDLKRLAKFLNKQYFSVNNTCGLHVHLDMRNRNVSKSYQKLLKFQDVLFSMVDKKRWTNDFCHYTTEDAIDAHDRYVAINEAAYDNHKTIEIRLHHATLDMKVVEKWVTLLVKILNSKLPAKVKTKADVLKWASKQKLGGYVRKTFNPDWMKVKNQYIDYDTDNYGDEDGYW